jgi:hypothetical protein
MEKKKRDPRTELTLTQRAIQSAVLQVAEGAPKVKTTIRLPKHIWRLTQLRALQEEKDLQDVVEAALAAYLATPVMKEGSR